MIKQVRHFIRSHLPTNLKWALMRFLADSVDFGRKVLEGIDPIWQTDPVFSKIFQQCRTRSLLDMRRAYVLHQFAQLAALIPGPIAEVGVYRGASSKIMLHAAGETKVLWGFDTFSGLPPIDSARDQFWAENELGETSLEEVRNFLHSPNVHLVEGIFPATAGVLPAGTTFSLVHIDVDLYKAALDCCAFFYDRLSPGGFMVFDDYGFLSCAGVRKAVDEFFSDKPSKPVYLPSGQAVFINIPRATAPGGSGIG